jgi:hypothetical protein
MTIHAGMPLTPVRVARCCTYSLLTEWQFDHHGKPFVEWGPQKVKDGSNPRMTEWGRRGCAMFPWRALIY